MKTVVLTSASSSRTPLTAIRERPEGRGDSWYFPGCRKDTNCHCEICLASIHATLDLVPSGSTIQQGSLTKLSTARPKRASAPSDPDETPPATPGTGSTGVASVSPPTKSTAKSRRTEKPIRKERSWVLGYRLLGLVAGFCLIWAVDSGVLAVILRDFGPRLTPEVVKQFAEESRAISGDLRVRLGYLQKKIEGVGGGVSNCSSMDSNWEFIQDGHIFFHWRCVIYQSLAEEVSVWGSPLRTSGLLPARSSPRLLSVLSGRITEWSEGRMAATPRTSNSSSSWISRQWSSAAVQLEARTWVLEYQRNALFQGLGLVSAAWEMLRVRGLRMVRELKQDPWRLLVLPVFADLPCHSSEENPIVHPT